jgi:sulfite exporter TauE/SafE
LIIKAFALGFSTGVFCMGYCAPVLMGLLFSRPTDRWSGSLKSLGLFLAGRLSAYLVFGMASYLMGEIFRSSSFFSDLLFPGGEVLLGILMILYCIYNHFPHLSFCSQTLKWSDSQWILFAAGFFTGINLCPPFILAVGTAMNSGTLLNSLLFFFTFFVATSIWLLPFVFSGMVSRSENLRSAARTVCGLTGLWLMFSGLNKLL